MPRQKSKAARRELSAAEVTQVQSEVEKFQQKWGMELTAQETSRVVDRATANLSKAESEIKVRPAVRNQMFAMLMEKSPAKAIRMRMEMYEKRGKTLTEAQKARVRAVAREKGFRAARMELNSIVKGRKTKKMEGGAVAGGGAARKKAAAVSMPAKKPKTRAKAAGGKSVQEVLASAEAANRNLRKIWDEHSRKRAAIVEKYEKDLVKPRVSGSVRDKTERMRAALEKNPEYRKEIVALEKETLAKLKVQKDRRDALLKTALQGMGVKGARLESIHKDLKDAREQMGTYRAIRTENFVREDLSSGVLENQQFVAVGIQKLKARAKRMQT